MLITFVLACTILVDGRKLYEFLAVTKVDGLPPVSSFVDVTGLVGPKISTEVLGHFGWLKIMFAKSDHS